MRRRTFMQLAGAGALAAILPLRGWAEGASDEGDDFDLAVVLNEIEALGPGLVDTLVAAQTVSVAETDAGGNPIVRSILTPSAMKAAFPNPPITEELRALLAKQKYWNLTEGDREVPVWPAVTTAPDYLHLALYAAPPDSFVLSADVLKLLAERNSFMLWDDAPIVVFGLRGCKLPDGIDATGWAREQALTLAAPTHLDLDCVVGLWRQADGMIALFRAGTVPAVGYMFTSLVTQGSGTSLLPTGLYQYRRGHHLPNANGIQRNALIMQGTYPVLRTAATLSYNPFLQTTAWTLGAGHNIHAGGPNFKYWSAGCQVVRGDYERSARIKTTGAWNDFRIMAGTADADGAAPAGGQVAFQYMLLTGLEAALAYEGKSGFMETYQPLRFGSSGPRVEALQARLVADYGEAVSGLLVNMRFDTATSFAALIDSKVSQGDFASPVVAGSW